MPRCCGESMKKLRDTITKINRFECKECGVKVYTNAIECLSLNAEVHQDVGLSRFANKNILAHLDARYVSTLKYQNRGLLASPDEELSPQKRHRKQSIQTILGYWEKLKKTRKRQKVMKNGNKK